MSFLDDIKKDTEATANSVEAPKHNRVSDEPVWNIKESKIRQMDIEMEQLEAIVQLIRKHHSGTYSDITMHCLSILLRECFSRLQSIYIDIGK